jgi:hypothetical protein
MNGHEGDLLFDETGALVSVEEPISIDALPAAAKAAIENSLPAERNQGRRIGDEGTDCDL